MLCTVKELIKRLEGDAEAAIDAVLDLAEKSLVTLHGLAQKDSSSLDEESILNFRKCLIAIQLVRLQTIPQISNPA